MIQIQKSRATEINSLHGELIGLFKKSVQTAVQIGGLLVDVKSELPHGEFSGWMSENISFSARTGRNYMKLYKNRDKVLEAGSISDAYKLLESKSETVSDIDQIKKHLKSVGVKKLIPAPGECIWLYSDSPKDESMKGGFDALAIKHSDQHEGYLNPSIYRIDGEYAYELYNERGGFKIDSEEMLIRLYKNKFEFMGVCGAE